jgi:hypothetical protein
MVSEPGMQKTQIIGFFFENRLQALLQQGISHATRVPSSHLLVSPSFPQSIYVPSAGVLGQHLSPILNCGYLYLPL